MRIAGWSSIATTRDAPAEPALRQASASAAATKNASAPRPARKTAAGSRRIAPSARARDMTPPQPKQSSAGAPVSIDTTEHASHTETAHAAQVDDAGRPQREHALARRSRQRR